MGSGGLDAYAPRQSTESATRWRQIGTNIVILTGLNFSPCHLVALLLSACWLVVPARGIEPTTRVRRGAELYAACARCHGDQGEGIEATRAPRLAGREDWFIKKQIKQFRQGERGKDDSKETGYLPPEARTQLMHPVADKLSRSDTRALIKFLTTLRPAPLAPAPLGDVARGRTLYSACIECHGKTAEGNRRKGAPRLTGQHDWYLFNQLLDFRMGWRGTDLKDPHVKHMRRRMDLDDASLHDLAAYIVSLNLQAPAPPAQP